MKTNSSGSAASTGLKPLGELEGSVAIQIFEEGIVAVTRTVVRINQKQPLIDTMMLEVAWFYNRKL